MQKRYLSPEEYESILRQKEEGIQSKDIAKAFGVCEATVSNVIHGRNKTRGKRRRAVGPPPSKCESEEMVFSELPDEVMFKHVRVWDYIG